ncbi:MAG: DMT family transporter [Ruminococcaceae bacterium]|nr:DMT family transporter [Oscillospiraceae bacterium]
MMKEQKTIQLAMCGALLANVIFGFSFLFTKLALNAASPVLLLAYRFTFAFLLMSLIAFFNPKLLRLKGKPLKNVILMGVCQPLLYFVCENYGMLYSSTTFAAVIIALVPIGAMLLGMVALKERCSFRQILCCVISVGGVIWLAVKNESEGHVTFFGIVLLAGAVLSASGFNVLSRKNAADFSAFERTYVMFTMAMVVFDFWALFETSGNVGALLSPLKDTGFLTSVLYLGGASSVGAFLMYNAATTYLPIARAAAFSSVITVVSLFAGVVFLNESFDVVSLVASGIIILGIWGVQKNS